MFNLNTWGPAPALCAACPGGGVRVSPAAAARRATDLGYADDITTDAAPLQKGCRASSTASVHTVASMASWPTTTCVGVGCWPGTAAEAGPYPLLGRATASPRLRLTRSRIWVWRCKKARCCHVLPGVRGPPPRPHEGHAGGHLRAAEGAAHPTRSQHCGWLYASVTAANALPARGTPHMSRLDDRSAA